jgi:hypothetical protein
MDEVVGNMVNIRDWAKKKGLNPNDVVYDANTKTVKVNGVDYGKGTPTYTKQYQPVRLSDTTGYSAPKQVQTGTKFDDEVLDDTFNRANLGSAQRSEQSARDRYVNTLTQGYKPGVFQYNQASDPAFQAATANYQRGLDNMLRQNMENASARGMYRSRGTSDRANQIVADETRRFNTEIAPQLEERAYNRYMQGEQMKRQTWQDNVQSLAAVYGIEKDNTASMQNIVENAEKQRKSVADALSKLYGIQVKTTVNTDDMYKQVAGMKTLAEREAERKRQALIEERNWKSDESAKDRSSREKINSDQIGSRESIAESDRNLKTTLSANELKAREIENDKQRKFLSAENDKKLKHDSTQKNLDRKAKGSSGGGGGGGGGGSKKGTDAPATSGKQSINFGSVKMVDDMIRQRIKMGGSDSGPNLPVIMSGNSDNKNKVSIHNNVSIKDLDNTSKKTVKNMINNSNLNYSEKKYLYQTYNLGARWDANFKPTKGVPTGSDWRKKEEIGKSNIALYVNRQKISQEDKEAMYDDMITWYGFVN